MLLTIVRSWYVNENRILGVSPFRYARAGFTNPIILPSGSLNQANTPSGNAIGPTIFFPPGATA